MSIRTRFRWVKWGFFLGLLIYPFTLWAQTPSPENAAWTPHSVVRRIVIPDTPPKPPTPAIPLSSTANLKLRLSTGNIQSALPTVDIFTYSYPTRESFIYPAIPVSKYPNLDISGFYEAKFSGRNYDPKVSTDSRWETIRRDPIYNKLPRDVLLGNPKLDLRYRFNISGKLDKDLTVFYDVEQEPDFPGKYDIRVKYKNTELTFYHFDVEFKDGEYINVRKALNGAKITSFTDEWETTVATGKLRSQPQRFEGYGSGSQKINLGARSILEDSLKVWVNNVPQVVGRDYDVNFYLGEITFKSTKGLNDYIVAIYEFTNPIEDFIPALSRKNFLGAQFLWRNKAAPREELFAKTVTDEVLKTQDSTPNSEYSLKQSPVVLGSETVKLNGRILKNGRDFFLKNQKGKLSIPTYLQLSRQDTLSISYDYLETETMTETLIGKNSPGPYFLSRKNIQDGSLSVFLNSEKMVEARDYILDYDGGKLLFNYKISYPSVIAVQYTSAKTQLIPPTKNNSPLTLGATYMTEYTQSQQDQLVLQAPTESITLSPTNNIVYLKNTPLTTTGNLSLILNNQKLVTADYVVVNPYQSKLQILKAYSGSPTLQAAYSYQKSFRTTFVIQGKNKGGLPYKNHEDFELRDIPMRYGGLAYIRILGNGISGEQVLNVGKEFIVDYGQDGQGINITFLTSSAGTGSQLTTYPDTSHRLTLIYDYTPPQSPNQGTLTQQMIGLTMGNRLSDNWTVNSEIAISGHNFAKPQIDFSTPTIPGTGVTNTTYDIGKRNIVENSESVYLNGIRQNKDADYTINYVLGTLRLINKTPGTQDKITIDGKFFDTGNTQATTAQTMKMATKFNTTYATPTLVIKGDLKFIDKDFLPIGEMREKKGSTVLGGSIDWKPTKGNSISGDYHHRDVYVGLSKDANKSLYLRSDELISIAEWKDVLNLFDTKNSLRLLSEIQDADASSTANPHAQDDLTWEYTGSIEFGPNWFRNSLIRGMSKKTSDYVDNTSPSNVGTEKTRFENKTFLKDVYALGETSIAPYFELSRADSESFSTTANHLVSNGIQYDSRTNFGHKTSIRPYTFLPININYDRQEIRTKISTQSTENVSFITNSFYDASFTPVNWFNAYISLRHAESESPLINQKGSVDDQKSYQIGKFAPQGMASLFGISEQHPVLVPFRGSFFGYSRSESNRLENNAKRNFGSETNRYSFSAFEPIDGIRLQSAAYETLLSKSLNTEGSSIASQNSGQSNSTKKELTFSVTPRLPILNLWSYTFGMEDRTSTIISHDQAFTGTSNRLTDTTPYFKRTQVLNYTPGNVVVPLFLFNWKLDLGRFNASLQESLEDKVNTKLTEQYPTLNLLSPKAVDTILQDNSYIHQYTATFGSSPLNLFNLSGTAKKGYERYSRNLILAATGTTHRNLTNISLNGDITPFGWIKLDGTGTYSTTLQYRSSQIETPLETLEKATNDQNFGILTEYLNNKQISGHLGTTLTPVSWFSITLGGDASRTSEQVLSTANNTTNIFTQKIGSIGNILRPFNGFSLSYVYSLKYTDSNAGQTSQGYGGITTLSYVPIQTPGFKVNISYIREDAWGRQLNSLDQTVSQQGNGYTLQTAIVDRNDTVETAILGIDITFPITDSPYLDSIVISGEGYLKKITDRQDPFKPDKKSYEISGFFLKGTLMF